MKQVLGANKEQMEMGPMGQGSVEAPGEPEAGLVLVHPVVLMLDLLSHLTLMPRKATELLALLCVGICSG